MPAAQSAKSSASSSPIALTDPKSVHRREGVGIWYGYRLRDTQFSR